MTLTVREQILANLQTTLEGISVDNGYDNDFSNVQRWLQAGNSYSNTPYIIIEAGEEEYNSAPNPLRSCKMAVYLEVGTVQSSDDTGSTDTLINSLLGDILKSVVVDITRGGIAKETNVLGAVPFEGTQGQPFVGVMVTLEIMYRYLFTDPKQAM